MLVAMLGIAACGDAQQAIRVYVTPTLDSASQPQLVYVTPTPQAVAQANPSPDALVAQHTTTPLPTPEIKPGVNYGPITGPNYTPEPLHTALPPVVSERACPAIVAVPSVSLYAEPNTTSQVVGSATERNRLPVSQLFTAPDGGEWANTSTGWLLLKDATATYALLDSMRSCDILLGNTPRSTLMGLHVVNGTQTESVLGFVRRMADAGLPLSTVKGLNDTEAMLNEIEVISPQTVTVYRSLLTPDGIYDCPQEIIDVGGNYPDPVATARKWISGLEGSWNGVNADYFEFINECPAPLDWISTFSIEAMRMANEQGRCLLLFSFPGGNPDMASFEQLLPAYQYALDNPCASGRTHGIALHAYSLEDNRLTSESDVWIAFRHRILYERLLLTLPPAADLPVYITEMGIGGGTIMPGCEAIIKDTLQYTYQVEEDPYVKGFHLWSVGTGVQWYDITPCLGQLGDALLTYYGQ